MALIEAQWVKRLLIRVNRLHDTLYNLDIVKITKDDLIRFRAAGYRQPIGFGQQGHDRVREILGRHLAENRPLMVSRLGSVELSALCHYLTRRQKGRRPYTHKIRSTMANPAGFFPTDDRSLDAFAEMFLSHIAQVDLMGVWYNHYESEVCNGYCPQASLVDLDCLEPFRFQHPWSGLLAGKKVLVIHPFVESIRRQYQEKRQLLFPSPEVLPEFELKTMQSVQSIAGSPVDFPSWFDAYRHMCDRIAKEDFEACLIGAGAYGLPLASFAKQLGKQAIHLGGVTQILFGIKGKRWEREYADSTAKLFNEHWVRPMTSETPANKDQIERGCYW
jgi:hypothetical protein